MYSVKSLPNFLVIGAARAGTTALYNFLVQHPQIFMPQLKEPGFLMLEGTNLDNPYSNRDYSITDLNTYQGLFADAQSTHTAIGEATTGYLTSAGVIPRIQKYMPEAKLIVLLRNPIDRAYSEWELLFRAGRETLSFAEVIAQEPKAPQSDLPWNPDERKYLRKGLYHAHLTRFYDNFDAEQISIHLYDDWRKKQLDVLSNIYAFLGVDPAFTPDTTIEHNVGGVPKNQMLYNLIFGNKTLKQVAKRVVPTKQIKQVRGLFLDRSKEELTAEIRSQLTEYYHADVTALGALLNRDLSGWLTPTPQGSAR